MRIKYAVLTLLMAMAPALLPGCQTNGDKGAATATKDASTGSAYNGKDQLKITEEPVTLRLFYPFGINGAPKGDMPVWQETAKITNVAMKNIANESITDEKQSFNTMLSSGDLPDIIHAKRDIINSVISQGALIPLDDLIAKYAPNIQKFLADFPEARLAGAGPRRAGQGTAFNGLLHPAGLAR
jgi:putative aldouronate transport system substrate-binding protein